MAILIDVLSRWAVFVPLTVIVAFGAEFAGCAERQRERGDPVEPYAYTGDVLIQVCMFSALFAVLKTLLGPRGAALVTTLIAAAGVHLLVLLWRSQTESETG